MVHRQTQALWLVAAAVLLCIPATTAAHQHSSLGSQSRKLLDTQTAQTTNTADSWIGDAARAAWNYISGSSNGSPCIECKDCTTNNCYSVCQKTCSAPPPPQPIVDGERCKAFGASAGAQVAQDACATAMLYCNGGRKPVGSFFPVTLQQCANIAYGVCQQQATAANAVSCSTYWAFGYKQCTASQFWDFYKGEVDDGCNQKVANIK